MNNDQKRPGGIKTPVRSLFQMLGHDSGSLSSLPVKRLDKAQQEMGGKKTGKGQGISISGNVGDIKTKVSIPQGGGKKVDGNPPRNKK